MLKRSVMALALMMMAVAVQVRAQAPASVGDIPERHFRHYKEVPVHLYNASFMSWAGDNLIDRLATGSAQAAEDRAKQLADLGLTGVVYNGRHFRLSYPEEEAAIREHARLVAEAAHRHGIAVIEHHEQTIYAYKSYPDMLRNLEWLQRDIRTGEPTRWVCSGNPDFLDYYANVLGGIQRRANVDGYMLDELANANKAACGCDHCRAAFKRDTGHDMPGTLEADPARRTPAQAAWVAWRSLTSARANTILMERVRQIRPDAARMTYGSDYSDSRTAASGMDLARDAALYGSFMGWEVMISEALNGWRPFLRELLLRNAMGNYYDIPVWSLNREVTTPDAVYYAWALCQAGKHAIWYGARGLDSDEELARFRSYNAWPHVMPHRHARTLTRTGVLLSDQTRQATDDRAFYWNDFTGWVEMLMEGNRPFDTLLDGDLWLEDRLGKYDVLLLASQANLSDLQIDRLKAWVRQGGTAILTKHSTLYDEHGKRRPDFALANEMNLRHQGDHRPGERVSGKLAGQEVSFVTRKGMANVALRRPAAQATRVLVKGDRSGHPAVVETAYGQGRFIYVAADLGSQNMETEPRNGTRYRTQEDPQMRHAIHAIHDHAHRRPTPASFDLPAGVIATVYQQQGGDAQGRIHVHLLNTTGKSIKPGDVSQFGRPETIPLPKVEAPLHIDLRADLRGSATVRTPERDQAVTLTPTRTADGAWRITVPGELLGAYLQVEVDAAPVQGQHKLPAPLMPGL